MERSIHQPGPIRQWGTSIEAFPLLCKRVVTAGNKMTEEHVHQYYELIFNFSDIAFCHTVNGREYESTGPSILFRAPYILHSSSTVTKDPYDRYELAFRPVVLTEFDGICELGALRGRWECMIPVTSEIMQNLCPLLERIRRVQEPGVPKRVFLSALAGLLYEVSELVPLAEAEEVPAPTYMQELLRYVVEHTDEQLSLEFLAKKFYISPSKLSRDFRLATQLSLHQYITAIRLERARVWLAEDMPLSFIAQRCGFSQESAFIYMFRRHTGLTPGEYRTRVKETNPG